MSSTLDRRNHRTLLLSSDWMQTLDPKYEQKISTLLSSCYQKFQFRHQCVAAITANWHPLPICKQLLLIWSSQLIRALSLSSPVLYRCSNGSLRRRRRRRQQQQQRIPAHKYQKRQQRQGQIDGHVFTGDDGADFFFFFLRKKTVASLIRASTNR